MSDVLFSFDGMSETALTFKIKALKKLGQKAYAQSVYDRFQKEYQQLYGEKYKENSLEEKDLMPCLGNFFSQKNKGTYYN